MCLLYETGVALAQANEEIGRLRHENERLHDVGGPSPTGTADDPLPTPPMTPTQT